MTETPKGPLAGIRIVEFDAIGPVPLCATILADLGADIVRLARAGGQAAYADVGGAILHRGRTAVELNLKDPADRAAALDLIGAADVLIEGFRPGVMERLGLGPDDCMAVNPALIYGRMTGWGQTGPLAPRAGHDINYIAIAGALGTMGEAGRPPMPPLNLVGDYGGGAMFLAMGVLAAVIEARSSGKGQVVDAAMTDGVAMLMSLFIALRQGSGWGPEREANLLDGGMPFYRCYECADGGYVAVGALEPQFFRALLDGLGLDPAKFPQMDKAGWPAMRDRFAACFGSKSRDEWAGVFDGSDACVSPVLDLLDAADHPHNAGRGTFLRHEGVVHPAPAPRFSRTPGAIRPAATRTAAEMLAVWTTGRSYGADDDINSK
ncbi:MULTISPECIES: CaiB/BaiF CoA transferase family protein [Actibacterium]|uniref:Alpha-methylacyl-CoA racemase n=1 Tax=Actibacterium naphthalenivorans TaxID=1614693 RepID=A0A840C6Z4_9RHOB|nr:MULTISPECIES: CaiB/BaiF CoA-transferase family protein [Actibacterium]MBB4021684.1 alpha-methylacyl-CoA racemase [Actibacterium naphthalenivorans]